MIIKRKISKLNINQNFLIITVKKPARRSQKKRTKRCRDSTNIIDLYNLIPNELLFQKKKSRLAQDESNVKYSNKLKTGEKSN